MERPDSRTDIEAEIARLPCWRGPITIAPLVGGITNRNYRVRCVDADFVVRFGADRPEHGIVRANELAAARAGFAAGLSPEIVHATPGVMVSRFIEGRTLEAADFTTPATLDAALRLLRRVHAEMAAHLDIPALLFWVFHVNRSYLRRLGRNGGRFGARLGYYAALNAALERRVGAVHLAFCHNDLLPGNWIDDGSRLWLIDWDYAGFDTPLFDLANFAANADFAPDRAVAMLAAYDGAPPDPARVRAFAALIAGSLLREVLWSAVSEQDPPTAFDYAAYTEAYAGRLAAALDNYRLAGDE